MGKAPHKHNPSLSPAPMYTGRNGGMGAREEKNEKGHDAFSSVKLA